MTTTDTDALQERIAEELYYDQHPEGRHRSEWPAAVYPDAAYEYRDLAAAVLPIIAAEVAKTLRAEAHALMDDIDEGPVTEKDVALFQVRDRLIHRATEYETRRSDEHR